MALSWLAVEKPWSVALAWPFLSFFTRTGVETAPLPFIFGTVDSFQSGEAFTGRRALTSLLMSGRDRGHVTPQDAT